MPAGTWFAGPLSVYPRSTAPGARRAWSGPKAHRRPRPRANASPWPRRSIPSMIDGWIREASWWRTIKEPAMPGKFLGGVVLGFASSVLILGVETAWGAVEYRITNLGTLGGTPSQALGLNNLGQ